MTARAGALDRPFAPARPFSTRAIRSGAWLLLPALLFLAAFYLYPLLRLALISIDAPNWSARHYVTFFTEDVYLRVLAQTFRIAGTVTLACLILGYPVAYFLSRVRGHWRAWLLILVVLPYLTSFLVRSYAWIVMLGRTGVVNTTLIDLGFIEQPLTLVYNQLGVHVGMVHVMLPLMILPIFSVMQGIDGRLVKAAESLGASPLRAHVKVFLPLSLPGVWGGCLLVFLLSLGFYVTPALLGGLRDVMLAAFIEAQITQTVHWGLAAAASLILLAITLIGFFAVGKFLGADALASIQGGTQMTAKRRFTWIGRAFSALSQIPALQSLRRFARRRRERRWARARRREAKGRRGAGRFLLPIFAAVVLVYLFVPTIIVVPMSFSSASFLRFPPPDLSLRWYDSFFNDGVWRGAMGLSLQIAILTTIVSTVLGTLSALAFRADWRFGRALVMGLLVSPIVVPSVVIGVSLYGPLAEMGLIGTFVGLIAGHTIGAIPFVVVIVRTTLSTVDRSLERAALSLGASPWRTQTRIVLPLIWPGMVSAGIFAFIHSFDELVITLFVAGVRIQTLPLKMWENIRNEIDPTIAAVACLLILVPVLALAAMQILRRHAPERLAR